MKTEDILIDDFTDPRFKKAFQAYFKELGISVRDWDGLFAEMNHDPNGKNYAYLRLAENGAVVGFLQFAPMHVKSWFFDTETGFIREFWVAEEYRGKGHGTQLLNCTEQYFAAHNILSTILTTDTAPDFYRKNGYVQMERIVAINKDPVFVKILPKA